MKNSLQKYFKTLDISYLKAFNTKPTVPYFENCDLFISSPNEDGDAEWLPKEIENIELNTDKNLSKELYEFYTSYYYLDLSGTYRNIDFYFNNQMYSNEAINKALNNAVSDGKYFFKDEDYMLIGSATKDDIDSLLVFYDNKNEVVFIYDPEFNKIIDSNFNLTEIIENLEPFF